MGIQKQNVKQQINILLLVILTLFYNRSSPIWKPQRNIKGSFIVTETAINFCSSGTDVRAIKSAESKAATGNKWEAISSVIKKYSKK